MERIICGGEERLEDGLRTGTCRPSVGRKVIVCRNAYQRDRKNKELSAAGQPGCKGGGKTVGRENGPVEKGAEA